MSWLQGRPQDRWTDAEKTHFLREIYTRVRFDSFTWNPPNVPATSTVDTTLTTVDAVELTGLRTGQAVYVSPPPGLDSGIVFGGACVTADNTLTIRLGNVTAGAINPGSGTWSYSGMVI